MSLVAYQYNILDIEKPIHYKIGPVTINLTGLKSDMPLNKDSN